METHTGFRACAKPSQPSRQRGEEAVPNTQDARLTVKLTGTNVEVLKPLVRVRGHPDD
jgi:hypothetical protein